MPYLKFASSALALSLAHSVLAQDECPPPGTCQSFGVDFTDGGTFFQNTLSNEQFNATQEFEGCQDDTSNNILIGPTGDSFECDGTSLVPADQDMTFSCPVQKSALESGDYSIVVISNNGGCNPIAFQRDFIINAAPQETETVTPTVTIETAFTPVVSSTETETSLVTRTARTSTVTVPRWNFNPTYTVYPRPTYTWVKDPIWTYTSTENVPTVVATSTIQSTAPCSQAPTKRDPQPTTVPPPLEEKFQDLADIVRRVLNAFGLKEREVLPGRSASTEFKRAIIEGRAIDPKAKEAWLRERHERLAAKNAGGIQKRAPDAPTLTITDSSAASTVTSTTSTAPTSTIFATTVVQSTTTTTPLATISRGFNFGISRETASQRTITKTIPVLGTQITVTSTTEATVTVTDITTPTSCP
ncbi:hypothetical protein NU195Hw_g1063t1 [Hortaea werneckii]